MTRSALLVLLGILIGVAAAYAMRLSPTKDPMSASTHSEAVSENACTTASDNDVLDPLSNTASKPNTQLTSAPTSTDATDQQSSTAGSDADLPQSAAKIADEKTKEHPISDTSNLPEAYRYLLEPRDASQRRLTPQEIQTFFSQDERDEDWAYTMELGIKGYLAANQNAGGTVIEHVECRGRMCQIAGVVYPGGNDDFDQHMTAMRGSGWWQLSNSQHSTGSNTDGTYRFVSFIPRGNEDTLAADLRSSICD